MKFLVLGGAGFLGSALVKALTQNEENAVVLFDRSMAPFTAPNLQQIIGQFSCDTDFSALTAGIDIVIHCISTTSPRNFPGFYDEFFQNVMPTIRLLDACVANGVRKTVYLSSGGTVYGESDGAALSECQNCSPICGYGVHKLSVEKIMHVYTHLYPIKCEVVRLANPYGPTQTTNGVGVIATFIRTIAARQSIQLIGDGSNRRDYIYIDDVIDAISSIIRYDGAVEVFNVGTGVGTSVLDIIQIISQKMNVTPHIDMVPGTGVDAACNILDITQLKRETGFTPRYSVEQGIDQMLCALRLLS